MTLRKRMRGVTLLELMIVVVIVGVLASIAYPSYRQHVQRAKRTEAMSTLLQIATEQERYYLNNNTYAGDLTALGFAQDPFTTETGTYVVVINNADADSYEATATYQVADAEGSKCGTFKINAAGAKTSAPNSDCWTSTR